MNCQDFENKISGYIDGELSQDERKLFEEHLASCRQCSDLLSELQSVDEMLTGMEPPLPDEAYWAGFDARLKEKVDRVSEKRPWWNFYPLIRRHLGWAAIAIVLVMIAVVPILRETMFFRVMETPSQRTTTPAASRELEEKESSGTGGEDTFFKAPEDTEVPEDRSAVEVTASSANQPSGKPQEAADESKPHSDKIASSVPKSEELTIVPPAAAPPRGVDDVRHKKAEIRRPEGVLSGEKMVPPTTTLKEKSQPAAVGSAPDYPTRYTSRPDKKAAIESFGGKKAEDNSTGSSVGRTMSPTVAKPIAVNESSKGKPTMADKAPPPPFPTIPGSEMDAPGSAPEATPAMRSYEEAPAVTQPESKAEAIGGAADESSKSEPAKMPSGLDMKNATFTKADMPPAKPSGKVFRDRTVLRKSSSEVNDYLATSEVVLIKLVAMSDNGTNLKNLRKQLTLSNYISELNRNAGRFRTDPVLEKHSREMQNITNEIMTVDPGELPRLKQKVIDSGIIDKTRELKK